VALSSTTAPSPSITSTCSQTPFKNTSLPFEIPAIISKGKGKSKLLLNDDDLPLVQLKKLKTDKQVSDSSISDSSDIESAAFSLTKLHGDQFYKGPVHKFLTSPILDSHGKFVDFMPPYGGGFDARGMEFHPGGGFAAAAHGAGAGPTFLNKEASPPVVCGAYSLLQGPRFVRSASMVESDHGDLHPVTVPPASVAISQGPVMRRFVRASRGRRLMTSPAALTQPTEATAVPSQSDMDILGESPLRPPPQV
jgi:hypothetical protein